MLLLWSDILTHTVCAEQAKRHTAQTCRLCQLKEAANQTGQPPALATLSWCKGTGLRNKRHLGSQEMLYMHPEDVKEKHTHAQWGLEKGRSLVVGAEGSTKINIYADT